LQINVKYPISGVVAMKYCMDGGRKPKHEQLEMLMHLTKSQIEVGNSHTDNLSI
jgi:hypothetical protein